ncbi:MAG: hypothetical protein IKZ87_04135 [Actinomycetaceae bacterium]|nr:hypothetical protein [Actinomycetaceae bacterium]
MSVIETFGILKEAGGWVKEKSLEFLKKASNDINLSQMTEDRDVRNMALRVAKDQESAMSKRDAEAFIKVLREIQTIMGAESSVKLASPRDSSLSLRIDRGCSIQIRQLEKAKPDTPPVFEVTLNNLAPYNAQATQQERSTKIKIDPTPLSPKEQVTALGGKYDAIVYSPAGLAPHITAWMRNAIATQHKLGKLDEVAYKEKSSVTLPATTVMAAFQGHALGAFHKASRYLSERTPLSTTIEDWAPAELITKAPPGVFDEIFRRYTTGSEADREKFEKHLSKGLAEISYYPPNTAESTISGDIKHAVFFEQNIELIARYLQPRDIEYDASIEERLDVTPIPADNLALNFVRAVRRQEDYLAKHVGENPSDLGNNCRVFVQLDGSMPAINKMSISQNNVNWAKSEILSIMDERMTADSSVRRSLLSDLVREADLSDEVFDSSDTPIDYCKKVLTAAVRDMEGDVSLVDESSALLDLQRDIVGQSADYTP